MKVRLLSNVNMEPLVRHLRPWPVSCGTYNSMLADLAASDGLGIGHGHHACSVHARHRCADGQRALWRGRAGAVRGIPRRAGQLLRALSPDRDREHILPANRWLGFADLTHRDPSRRMKAASTRALSPLPKTQAPISSSSTWIFCSGGMASDTLLSNTFWYAGRIRYFHQYVRVLWPRHCIGLLEAYSQPARKGTRRLILTIRFGAASSASLDRQKSPSLKTDPGPVLRVFNAAFKAVQRTGVLLVAVTKNNVAVCRRGLRPKPDDDSAARGFCHDARQLDCKSWRISPSFPNRSIFGTDSFVFIDDNPVERDAVRKFMPEIAVPEFPDRTENLPTWFQQRDRACVFRKIYCDDRGITAKTAAVPRPRGTSEACRQLRPRRISRRARNRMRNPR